MFQLGIQSSVWLTDWLEQSSGHCSEISWQAHWREVSLTAALSFPILELNPIVGNTASYREILPSEELVTGERERETFLPEMMKQRRIDARWIRIYFFILHSLPLPLSLARSPNCLFRSLSVNITSGGPFAVSVELRYNPLMRAAHPPNTLPTGCVWMIHCL